MPLVRIFNRGCRAICFDILNQPPHLFDLPDLSSNDLISQFAHPQILDLRSLTCQDGDGVMGDHSFHVINLRDCCLASDQE